jgi:hypothetical protein
MRAQHRLQQAADVLVQRLLSFALDGNVADPVALQAIRGALDRAGLKPGIDVDVRLKPFESIFEQVESGESRAEFRGESVMELIEAQDDDEQPALAAPIEDTEDVLDVDVIEPEPITPDDEKRSMTPTTPPPRPQQSHRASRLGGALGHVDFFLVLVRQERWLRRCHDGRRRRA